MIGFAIVGVFFHVYINNTTRLTKTFTYIFCLCVPSITSPQLGMRDQQTDSILKTNTIYK